MTVQSRSVVWRRAVLLAAVFLTMIAAQVVVGSELDTLRLLQLVLGAEPQEFADVKFTHSVLPRIAMAVMCGAALGLAGSILQQVTQNPLAAPMTFGAASGAWLAIVAATLMLPTLATNHAEWVAMTGATLAFGLVVAIAGLRGLTGLNAVLAGMAVNLLQIGRAHV